MDNECTCKGLQDGKEYEFRVAAVNDAGPGDFAMTTDGIMARAPPGVYKQIEAVPHRLGIIWK